jgi:flagellar hook assembly protein FlgD
MKGFLRVILSGIFVLAIVASAQAATIRVPGDQATIQAGTYKGLGNKNLDLKGKAITVKSENGAGVTIIDCEGSGRGFNFKSGETAKSVISGFTITNGAPTGNQVQIGVNSQTDAARWDGTDENGEKAASGVYFYTIQAGEFTATRKMLMLE